MTKFFLRERKVYNFRRIPINKWQMKCEIAERQVSEQRRLSYASFQGRAVVRQGQLRQPGGGARQGVPAQVRNTTFGLLNFKSQTDHGEIKTSRQIRKSSLHLLFFLYSIYQRENFFLRPKQYFLLGAGSSRRQCHRLNLGRSKRKMRT